MTTLNKKKRFVAFPLLLGVFVMFLLYLRVPEIEKIFALYTNGSLWFVFGMVAKGHNYGVCRKCGKVHSSSGIAEANRKRVWTSEMRAKISRAFKSRPSHRKGKHLPTSHRINIAFGMKKSKVFRERVREYHEEKVKAFLRELYDLPKDVEFVPASIYDHIFARKVLIEETSHRSFVHTRLPECPDWVKNNGNGKAVSAVI